jgi:hypothetical protein
VEEVEYIEALKYVERQEFIRIGSILLLVHSLGLRRTVYLRI